VRILGWPAPVATAAQRIRTGEGCGVRTHSWGDIPEIGGPFVSVSLAALDDLPLEDLIGAPLVHMDGRHDNWFEAPAEIRHL
jgi:hypothetical protein